MVTGALFLPLECRHSLVLAHVEELQVCEWFWENRPFLSWDLGAGVYAKQKAVSVSVSMCPGCAVGDIDRCEVVKIPAIFSCPSDFGLGCTIYGIVDPSEFNGVLFMFSCSPFSVLLFPVFFLSLIFTVFCTS